MHAPRSFALRRITGGVVSVVVSVAACVGACVAVCVVVAGCASPRARVQSAPRGGAAHDAAGARHAAVAAIAWRHWDRASFDEARADHKIIVVTVATEWCHWCHVMDDETWSDPAVRALVADRFVAVREDADARPDLAERYADWGWPAIALLGPDGAPITELRGYQEKTAFLALLRSLVDKIDAGEHLSRASVAGPRASVAAGAAPTAGGAAGADRLAATEAFAREQLDAVYDEAQGGWGRVQKYPLYAPPEEALLRAFLTGDNGARDRALFTVDRERALVDPVDGGMFQYSLDGVWTAPHYEKLAAINGDALGTFALAVRAARAAGDDAAAARFEAAGRLIHRYLTTTLRAPSGAFYANQDADVGTRGDRPFVVGKSWYALSRADRDKAGAPFVDRHVYASHNGRIITGMARFGAAVHDDAVVADATRAFDAVCATHRHDGGFLHDAGRPLEHLADDVAMARAALALYEATGDARFRVEARAVAKALLRLRDGEGGALLEHARDDSVFDLDARRPLRANAEAARFLQKLGRLDDDAALEGAAAQILAAFADEPAVREEGRMIGPYVLALEEARAEPLHFAVVTAHAGDAASRALYRAALDVYAPHRLIETVAPGAKFPDLGKPALYLCGASFCSPPMTDPASVARRARPFLRPRT